MWRDLKRTNILVEMLDVTFVRHVINAIKTY
jgi:hypothetical protein